MLYQLRRIFVMLLLCCICVVGNVAGQNLAIEQPDKVEQEQIVSQALPSNAKPFTFRFLFDNTKELSNDLVLPLLWFQLLDSFTREPAQIVIEQVNFLEPQHFLFILNKLQLQQKALSLTDWC